MTNEWDTNSPGRATTIVIFGASGDLARRKLVPALYNLNREGHLPGHVRVVGVARRAYDHGEFRHLMREAAEQFAATTFDSASWDGFASSLYYVHGCMLLSECRSMPAARSERPRRMRTTLTIIG